MMIIKQAEKEKEARKWATAIARELCPLWQQGKNYGHYRKVKYALMSASRKIMILWIKPRNT